MVEVVLEIRADTLAQIDDLRETCKPVEITREKMLRLMVQTGIVYWEANSEALGAEEEEATAAQQQKRDVPGKGGKI
jgi:hypothetical protein